MGKESNQSTLDTLDRYFALWIRNRLWNRYLTKVSTLDGILRHKLGHVHVVDTSFPQVDTPSRDQTVLVINKRENPTIQMVI